MTMTHTRLAVAALALGIAAAPAIASAHDGGRYHHDRGHHYGHYRHAPYAHYRYGYRYAPVRYVYVRPAPRVIYYDDDYYAYRPYYPRYRYYSRPGLSVSVGYADGPFYGGYSYRRW